MWYHLSTTAWCGAAVSGCSDAIADSDSHCGVLQRWPVVGETDMPSQTLGTEELLGEVLAELEGRLVTIGAGVVGLLAPGLSEDHVRSRLGELGMEPPGELVAWFGWHDGLINPDPAFERYDRVIKWHPMSLEQCILDWSGQPRGAEDWQWDPTWLPIGHHDNSDRLTVDCTPPQQWQARLSIYSAVEGGFGRCEAPVVTGFAGVARWWLDALDAGHITYVPEADMFDVTNGNQVPWERGRTFLI